MTLQQDCNPTFAGHQTFHPRFGWLKKGFDAVEADPRAFDDDDAPLKLGVGKNMVEAIRFWGVATKAWNRIPDPTRKRAKLHVPTGFGEALLSDTGFDPFLENPGSLWLLHWFALSTPSSLPVWWLTFNQFSAVEFSDDDLDRFCIEEIHGTTWTQPNPNSVKKDVDCLLRMYSRRNMRGRQTLDDLLDSPFRELEVIVPSGVTGSDFRFALGPKTSLPAEIVTFACLDFLATSESHARSATLTRLTMDAGSPGRLFKLTENNIADSIEETMAVNDHISLASPGGAAQLTVDGHVTGVAESVLKTFYKKRGSRAKVRKGLTYAGAEARFPSDAQWESSTTAGQSRIRADVPA